MNPVVMPETEVYYAEQPLYAHTLHSALVLLFLTVQSQIH